MKIFYKIIFGFLVVTMLFGLISIIGIRTTDSILESYNLIEKETIPIIETLGDIKSAEIRIVMSTHDLPYNTSGNTTSAIFDTKEKILRSQIEIYDISLRKYGELIGRFFPDEKELFNDINTTSYKLKTISFEMIDLKKHDAPDEKIKEKMKEFDESEINLLTALEKSQANEDNELAERTAELNATIADSRTRLKIFTVFTFAATILIGVYISRSISNPITRLKEATTQVSKGKLDTSIDIRTGDEIEDLADSFNRMTGELERDITERKKSDLEYKTILKTAMDGFYVIDLKGHIMDVNDSYCSLIGYSREELLNMTLKDIDVIDTEEIIAKRIERILKVGWERFETSHRCKDGRIVELEASVNYIGIENGKFYCFMRDITERKRTEELLHENQSLVLADKAKNAFLDTMSHELRTPLNAILGFSELIRQKAHGDRNEVQMRYADNVLMGGNNMLNLINDILDFNRIEAGKMELVFENVLLKAIIDESIDLIKEKATSQGIVLKKELDPELDFISSDKQKVKQILFNLLSNAVKFSKPEGGVVTIKTGKDGDFARICVSDTGIGIEEKDMGRLFKEFGQLDTGSSRKYGGTGMGLAISKKLVEMHGGRIWAQSKYGEGTTFTFTLPLAARKEKSEV